LTRFHGERPPAPDWFLKAIETPYETGSVDVNGAEIAWQAWGDVSLPGLLLIHGNGAHAHWWDFVAPYFAGTHRVVAFSMGGMGESSWRDSYTMDQFAAEIPAVAEAAGLFEHAEKPMIAAHSFGGFIALMATNKVGGRFKGAIIIDSYMPLPDEQRHGPPPNIGKNRVYDDLPKALSRFRLAPPQPCENAFIMDYIARWSLKRIDEGDGLTWRFDPNIWGNRRELDIDYDPILTGAKCPLAFMRGEDSVLVTKKTFAYIEQLLGSDIPMVTVPEAQHHIWLDQPIAFVSALRAMLESWSP